MDRLGSTASCVELAPASGANASLASWPSSTWSVCTRARNGAEAVSTWLQLRTSSIATSSATRPDERWVADITEFMTGEGKLFLAGVKDLYGRGLVGWSMSTRQTSELVIEAVSMAVARRDPVIPPLHHSDKGCQYTSLEFTNRLHELGLVPSYGSTGDCYDNAAMETFWATLKRELSWIHGPLIYMNRARLRSALFDYIEIFYNRERAQAGLGHLSPLDYEAALVVA